MPPPSALSFPPPSATPPASALSFPPPSATPPASALTFPPSSATSPRVSPPPVFSVLGRALRVPALTFPPFSVPRPSRLPSPFLRPSATSPASAPWFSRSSVAAPCVCHRLPPVIAHAPLVFRSSSPRGATAQTWPASRAWVGSGRMLQRCRASSSRSSSRSRPSRPSPRLGPRGRRPSPGSASRGRRATIQARVAKSLKALLQRAAKKASFGKAKSVGLTARVVEYRVEEHGDVLRITCAIHGQVVGGAGARPRISFGGSPAKRQELEAAGALDGGQRPRDPPRPDRAHRPRRRARAALSWREGSTAPAGCPTTLSRRPRAGRRDRTQGRRERRWNTTACWPSFFEGEDAPRARCGRPADGARPPLARRGRGRAGQPARVPARADGAALPLRRDGAVSAARAAARPRPRGCRWR